MSSFEWLSEEAWALIEPHLPKKRAGARRVDDRRVSSGIPHVVKLGCRWRDCLAVYGPPPPRSTTATIAGAHKVFGDACSNGRLPKARCRQTLHRRHRGEGSSLCQQCKRGKRRSGRPFARGADEQGPRGVDDARGRPIVFMLTPGNVADISVAAQLLETITPPRRLPADKAYDAEHLRKWLKSRDVQAVIPTSASRCKPYPPIVKPPAAKRQRAYVLLHEELASLRHPL